MSMRYFFLLSDFLIKCPLNVKFIMIIKKIFSLLKLHEIEVQYRLSGFWAKKLII
jgi:hypothetical protein